MENRKTQNIGRPPLVSDHVLRAVLHLLREGCRWRALPSHWGRWNTIYRCWRRWVEAGLWTEILGHLARKPKGQLLPLLAKTMVFVGDKGFDSDELRQLIEGNGGLACIPPRSNRTSHRWCDPEFYRKRHLVENIFQRIKYWRRVATPYEKLASTFLAFSTLASSIDYIRRQ